MFWCRYFSRRRRHWICNIYQCLWTGKCLAIPCSLWWLCWANRWTMLNEDSMGKYSGRIFTTIFTFSCHIYLFLQLEYRLLLRFGMPQCHKGAAQHGLHSSRHQTRKLCAWLTEHSTWEPHLHGGFWNSTEDYQWWRLHSHTKEKGMWSVVFHCISQKWELSLINPFQRRNFSSPCEHYIDYWLNF